MPIRFPCAHCQKVVTANTRLCGKPLLCPACNRTLVVPAAAVLSRPEHSIQPQPAAAPAVGPSSGPIVTVPCRFIASRRIPPVIDLRVVGLAAGLAVLVVSGLLAYVTSSTRPTPAAMKLMARMDTTEVEGEVPLRSSEPPTPVAPSKVQPPAAVVAELIEVSPTRIEEPAIEPVGAEPPAPTPAAPAPAATREPALAPAVAVHRIRHLSDEDLRKQLLKMPEVSLDHGTRTSAHIINLAHQQHGFNPKARKQPHIIPTLLAQRPDLNGLPMRMGDDCQLGKDAAESLQALSRLLRAAISSSVPKSGSDPRPDPCVLRQKLLGGPGEGKDNEKQTAGAFEEELKRAVARREWQQPAAIPTLQQMLQAENVALRMLLVELLGQIKDHSASTALAQRALFDLSPQVRTAAIEQLQHRPREEYRAVLLDGFRYPWAPVADHAAEALVALQDREALPQLHRIRSERDPSMPFQGRKGGWQVREVVRVNHLSNCLLCHAPSLDRTDLVRGRIPTPGQPLPPPTEVQYYEGNQGIFVRADVTYLKQDFSVPQPVEKPGAWPTMQRYDYLVRTRPALTEDLKRQPSAERMEAIRFAIARLSRD